MLTKIIDQAKVETFVHWMEEAEEVVIVSHISPDGDAVGSSLGLWHYLTGCGKSVHVITPNAFPDFLKWMEGSKEVLFYDKYHDFANQLIKRADVICCLDFNVPSRIGDMAEAVIQSKAKKILIDHHLDPGSFTDVVISHPHIASTSELVFRLLCQMGAFSDITKAGAECIYTGMMTDTGGFAFNSNSPEIYFIISELLTKGIDKDAIYRKVFNTYSESRLRLMGYVLTTMKCYPAARAALLTLTKEEQSRFDYIKGDSEGFVNLPLQIRHTVLSGFLREDTERKLIRVSLRSVGSFPCNLMAAEFFNGGGHRNASGGELVGYTMEQAIARFEEALAAYQAVLETAKE